MLTVLRVCREASPGVAAPEDMIWEVDEDGDGYVSWDEYISAYERAVADKAEVEPRKLSTLVEFLLLDEEENNWVDLLFLLNITAGCCRCGLRSASRAYVRGYCTADYRRLDCKPYGDATRTRVSRCSHPSDVWRRWVRSHGGSENYVPGIRGGWQPDRFWSQDTAAWLPEASHKMTVSNNGNEYWAFGRVPTFVSSGSARQMPWLCRCPAH